MSLGQLGGLVETYNMGAALASAPILAYVTGGGISPAAVGQAFVAVGGGLVMAQSIYSAARKANVEINSSEALPTLDKPMAAAGIAAASIITLPGIGVESVPELVAVAVGAFTGNRFAMALNQGEDLVDALQSAVGLKAVGM